MKHIFLFSFAILISLISVAQTVEGVKNGPVITFAEKTHDFGDIQQGEKIEYVFKFQNTGTQPLVISDVMTTCQCTAKQWSKAPVMPGKSSQITVSFDSAGKMGIQNKVITIQSNATNSTERVSIRVNVLPPANK
jgi:hypothetical protein